MSRQMLVQGQVYRLQAPRSVRAARPAGSSLGLAWRLAGTALLGLIAAGIVALLGHGGNVGVGASPVALPMPASKPGGNGWKPAETAAAPPAELARAPVPPSPADKAGEKPATALVSPAPSPPLPAWNPSPAPVTPGLPPVAPALTATAPAASVPAASPAPAPSAAPLDAAAAQRSAEPPPPVAALADDPKPAATKVDAGAGRAVPSGSGAPTDCLPQGLQSVLADLQAEFGPVTVVSTTHLHTDNHIKGSVRDKMHQACKAVDFKATGEPKAILAYLKTRREVAGVNVYKNNGLIHIDHAGGSVASVAPKAAAKPAAKAAQPKAKPRRTARKTSAASTQAEPAAD